jgi:hypothetical protein
MHQLCSRAALGLLAFFLPLTFASGQGHEPTGKSHPSYLLFYTPGDGSVRQVDPETGTVSEPIAVSVPNTFTISVHWFAYDWPGNKMYVVYSNNPDPTLLLGTTDPRAWHITPIGPLTLEVITVNSAFGCTKAQGLAYSQQTGYLYMHGGGGISGCVSVYAIDPRTATVTLGDYGYDSNCIDGFIPYVLTNDVDGNLWYSIDSDSGYAAVFEAIPGQRMDNWPRHKYSAAWLVTPPAPFPDPDFPGGYNPVPEEGLKAVAVHPEDNRVFAVVNSSWVKGFGTLRNFQITYGAGATITLTEMDDVINPDFPIPQMGGPLSLVFVPWEIPESSP